MRWLAVISVFPLLGCYQYVRVEPTARAAGGAQVRAQLTLDGSARLAPYVGTDVQFVEGRMLDAADSAVTVSLTATVSRLNVQRHWAGERLTLPRSAFARLDRRRFDSKRTWWFTAALVGGAVILGSTLDVIGGGGSRGGRPGGQPQ